MKKYSLFSLFVVPFMFFSCSEPEVTPSPQKITYRLIVKDCGNRVCCTFDSIQYNFSEPIVYDTSFYRNVNELCYFSVYGDCNDDQKLSFVMQILRNDVEVKSKSFTRQYICGSVQLEMNYYITP